MAVEVYINDERLDLKDNVGMGLTFQVGSIFNPNNRAGNLSNKFKVPKTRNNTRILGNLSNINSTTEIPYRRNSARVRQDGVELFPNGFAVIGQTGKEYNLTVYSGNVSFFDLIKERNINELFFEEVQYSITPMINTFDGSKDIMYPIVDYGLNTELLDNTDTQNIDALFPALFAKSILDKIVDSVGYKVTGSFIDSDVYSRLLFTINQWGYSQEIADATSGIVDTPVAINQDVFGALDPGFSTTFDIDFTNNSGWSSFDLIDDEFTPDSTYRGTFQLGCNGSVKNISATNNMSLRVYSEVYEDGVLILTDNTPLISVSIGATAVYLSPLFFENVTAFKGKKYKAKVRVRVRTDAAIQPCLNFKLDDARFRFYAGVDIPYTATIKPGTFYDFSQSDFLKELINMYSLTVQTNDLTKELSLNFLDDIQDNIGVAIDWSGKIDLAKTPSVKYTIPNYAQSNWFKYSKSEEDNTQFADDKLDVDNESLKPSRDVLVLKTVASNDGFKATDKAPLIPIQTEIAKAFDKKKNRFILLDSKNKTINFKTSINGDTVTVSNDIPFAYFKKQGASDSLDWTSLLAANYKTLKSILNQSKVVTAAFRLTPVDISNLDFLIPIYLDVHTPDVNINGYFYINKVSNFKKDKSTSVELIRL